MAWILDHVANSIVALQHQNTILSGNESFIKVEIGIPTVDA